MIRCRLPFRLASYVSATLLAFVSAISCGSNSNPSNGVSQSQSVARVSTIDASWPQLYTDLQSLKSASDAVVSGKVSKAHATVRSGKPGYPTTDYEFTVSKVVWNSSGTDITSPVLLHQTGGVLDGTQYAVDDDPNFTIGEQDVLFLHEYTSGHFYVVGGPTGRFRVTDGMISPMNDEGIQLPRTALDDFYTQIAQA